MLVVAMGVDFNTQSSVKACEKPFFHPLQVSPNQRGHILFHQRNSCHPFASQAHRYNPAGVAPSALRSRWPGQTPYSFLESGTCNINCQREAVRNTGGVPFFDGFNAVGGENCTNFLHCCNGAASLYCASSRFSLRSIFILLVYCVFSQISCDMVLQNAVKSIFSSFSLINLLISMCLFLLQRLNNWQFSVQFISQRRV